MIQLTIRDDNEKVNGKTIWINPDHIVLFAIEHGKTGIVLSKSEEWMFVKETPEDIVQKITTARIVAKAGHLEL